jgi:hypothetical protein
LPAEPASAQPGRLGMRRGDAHAAGERPGFVASRRDVAHTSREQVDGVPLRLRGRRLRAVRGNQLIVQLVGLRLCSHLAPGSRAGSASTTYVVASRQVERGVSHSCRIATPRLRSWDDAFVPP